MVRKMAHKMVTETVRRENEALIDEMSRFNAALACGAMSCSTPRRAIGRCLVWKQAGGTWGPRSNGRKMCGSDRGAKHYFFSRGTARA
jgi:hypothetical protein